MDFTNLDRALDDFGTRIIDEMQNQLFENNSVASGDLARSITANIISLPNDQGEALRVSLLWYGELLEDGKKIPVPAKFKSPKSFAFAIARSIGKKGVIRYPKKPFIMESINNAAANFGNEAIMQAVENDIIININDSVESAGGTIT